MTNMTFAERCTLSEQCLPDAPYRAMLTKLHGEMLQEIERLNAEVLEQCRINGMSAEREDALRAELTRLKASIALDKKAENARELGLDYEPAPVQEPRGYQWFDTAVVRNENAKLSAWHPLYTTPPAPQPVPVKTYSDGKPWPVAPKPWVGLTDEDIDALRKSVNPHLSFEQGALLFARAIEAKLKEKNT
jgi:hypothetical protein